jgi:glutamate synthase domain-containing protein 2
MDTMDIAYWVYTILAWLAGLVMLLLFVLFVQDITQTKSAVRRNFPVIGRMRYFLERQGEFFRQYFFAHDREELPFNRATRSWVYRKAKGLSGTIGFGSTNDLREPGSVIFVNSPYAILESEQECTPPMVIGEGCVHPYAAPNIVNISGMSYGAISRPAVEALSKGAAMGGVWLNTGEGGLSPFHLSGNCDVVFQIGTAKFGVRDEQGRLDQQKLKEIARHEQVKMFELKISQGAKPGKGGILPGGKITPEIAEIRGVPVGVDAISPNRHAEIKGPDDLLDMINRVRDVTGKPVGFKTVIGAERYPEMLVEAILRRGPDAAPDFITLDGGEGGSGASPQALADHVGLPLTESLPILTNILHEAGLGERTRVIASGKLVTSDRVAWALCMGADFVVSARGFMFALGCIQSLQCHQNTCPTGITTHNPRLQKGLVVTDKAQRVANYAIQINDELDVIAHSCGLSYAREFNRDHVRIVQQAGRSVLASQLYPYPQINSKRFIGR